jgi:FkbM family methyltransferase
MIIPLNKLIEKYNLNISGVIHIGAHCGQEYKDYEAVGISNMILFEPCKKTFEGLINNLPKSEHIKAFNVALGNKSGEMEMFTETANHGLSNSLLEPKEHLKQYPKIKFESKETVMMNRLDEVEYDRTLYNMINIDVQGYELEVFKGAKESLKHIRIIYSEINLIEMYKGCVLVSELDEFLKQFNFYRILSDTRFKTWGDALYLRYD